LKLSDTARQDRLEKQEKGKIETAPPTVDDVVDLPHATRALVNKFTLRPSDYREVLKLLKANQIHAGFHVPGSPNIWVPVRQPYWLRLASNRFATKSESGSRVHRVKLSAFREEYIQACLDAQAAKSISPERVRTIFNDLSREEGHFFDVVISKTSWSHFTETNQIGEAPSGQSSPGSGRRELGSWKLLMPYFAAFMAAEARKNPDFGAHLDAKKLTLEVLGYAKRQNPGQAFPTGVEVEVRKFLSLLPAEWPL
jgi:hypothetical protein